MHNIIQVCYNSTDNILGKNVIYYALILACYEDNIILKERKMSGVLSRLVRRVPPFKNMYHQMDDLRKRNEQLSRENTALRNDYTALAKRCEYIFEVEQRFEKNMSTHYELLKQEVRNTEEELQNHRKAQDKRHEGVVARIEGNHKAIVDKEKKDFAHLESVDRQLMKDIQYYYYKGLHPDQYEENLAEWYQMMTGKGLDLNHPVTFNEKVQWLKLYDSTELKTRLADKYLVRDYVAEKIGSQYLIPILGVYDSFEDIDFEKLPQRFVMKTNHASGWNIIVKDKEHFNKEEARSKFKFWLHRNYAYSSGLELHYKDIPPKIVIEEYIENGEDELFDYRFFCFSGKAYSIWIDVDSGKPTHRRNIYDLDWNLLPIKVNYPNDASLERKPEHLKEMIELAEQLSEGINMVRVDLYEVAGKIYFGEMTFTPQSGQGKWEPEEYNKLYGDQIILPEIEK